jgi:hypothetical protein
VELSGKTARFHPRHVEPERDQILNASDNSLNGDVGLEEAARFHRSVVDLPQC